MVSGMEFASLASSQRLSGHRVVGAEKVTEKVKGDRRQRAARRMLDSQAGHYIGERGAGTDKFELHAHMRTDLKHWVLKPGRVCHTFAIASQNASLRI